MIATLLVNAPPKNSKIEKPRLSKKATRILCWDVVFVGEAFVGEIFVEVVFVGVVFDCFLDIVLLK